MTASILPSLSYKPCAYFHGDIKKMSMGNCIAFTTAAVSISFHAAMLSLIIKLNRYVLGVPNLIWKNLIKWNVK